jgi:ATP/maltotriose-dependent transcriptional regulator MalT
MSGWSRGDYHVIDAGDVQDGMAFLLDHLPSQLHVVIAGRADPALPLAGLRARGELAEIRAAELRFTPDEAAAYFNGMMGLQLTARDVAVLEARTEGWIAALQLAALSMQGRDDIGGFIAGFAGDDRYVVDYLAEEVLQRQSDRVQTFLLQTSILGRLSGPLCDAVTGQGGGKAMLEALDRGNLFLVPLDDRRRWYRYHHLFADVLQARLLDEQPGQVPDLHRRASAWYEQNGEQPVAISHALAAGDFERAADLVELAIPAMRRGRQEAAVRGWLEVLPGELIRARPVLSVAYAWALLVSGELDGVQTRLRPVPALTARAWIAQGRLGEALGWANEQGLSADDDLSYLREFEHITLARVFLARHEGERAERSVHEATQLLERLLLAAEEGGRTGRVIEILVLQALAHQTLGDIPAALASLERPVTLAEPEGYVRVFVDEGPPMTSLLRAAAKQGIRRDYVRRLLAAVSKTDHGSPREQALIEPLSERELDVLRLLGTELDGPAIARELMVSLNTMRTHTKNIYAKLAVASRRAAVRRAAELDLLPRTSSRQP